MKLHIGCGSVVLPGWTNLDAKPGPGIDIVDNARWLGQVEVESCDEIYASHILDHFSRTETDEVLKVWFSRLKRGGVLRLAVSDFAAIAEEYRAGTPLHSLLGLLIGGHKDGFDKHGTAFDRASLEGALIRAGFVDIKPWDWRETDHADHDDFSQAYMPHLQKQSGRLMSLNLQARRKPAASVETLDEGVGPRFYRGQIAKHGLSPEGSVPDLFIRQAEQAAIVEALTALGGTHRAILEVGCGSGLLLARLYELGFERVAAFDALPEFVELAQSRGLPYHIWQSTVQNICGGFRDGKPIAVPLSDAQYDIVVSQRVVINVLDKDDQAEAFAEMRRVLKPGGYLVLVEAFADAWHNLNEARAEFDLTPHPMAAHNRWLEREEFEEYTRGLESIAGVDDHLLQPPNFLSSYFYASRVLHDLARGAAGQAVDAPPKRNSLFTQFMGAALPPAGNYANIQFYVFRKPAR